MSAFNEFWFQTSGGYNPDLIGNSLRFRDNNKQLNRTFSNDRPLPNHTFSAWVKRGKLGVQQKIFEAAAGGGKQLIEFWDTDKIHVGFFNSLKIETQARFRDPSAWYHIFFNRDGGTFKLFVNNVLVGSFTDNPNALAGFGQSVPHGVGCVPGYNTSLDGYMAEVYFVNGTTYQPTDFGEYNAEGVWMPKEVSGLTYGTNSFYLDFSDPNNIGADRFGNGNNFTATGFELSNTASADYDSMTDSPTNNYCTLSPISGDHWKIQKANLTTDQGGAAYRNVIATHQIPPGSSKIYFEARVGRTTGGANGVRFGLAGTAMFNINNPPTPNAFIELAGGGGSVRVNNSSVGSISGVSAGGILQCAYDPSNGKVWFGVNNSWYFSGNPSTGANPAGTLTSSTLSVWGSNYDDSLDFNWGNRPYTHTPPTGFGPLSTESLPRPSLPATITGTFTGNNNSDGPFVYTGCIPGRIQYGSVDVLYQNRLGQSNVDFLSNGFKVRSGTSNSGTVSYTVTTTHTGGEYNGRQVPFGGTGVSPATAVSN